MIDHGLLSDKVISLSLFDMATVYSSRKNGRNIVIIFYQFKHLFWRLNETVLVYTQHMF